MKKFGGDWTQQKLDSLLDYTRAYFKVFKNQSWAEKIYFDGFAGSGEASVIEANQEISLIDFMDDIDPEELNVYEGAARQIVLMEENDFQYHILIDKDPENIKTLKSLYLHAPNVGENQVFVRDEDCNEALDFLIKMMKANRRRRALAFLDPFGMQINWDSIKKLKEVNHPKGGVDLWILVPSGVAINRLLPRSAENRNPANEKRLEQYLGMGIDEIRKSFYEKGETKREKQGQPSLFDLVDDPEFNIESEALYKIDKPIEKIMQIYRTQLKTVWKYVTEKPLVLTNSKNAPIFHFVFATNNPTALRIAEHIIKKRQV